MSSPSKPEFLDWTKRHRCRNSYCNAGMSGGSRFSTSKQLIARLGQTHHVHVRVVPSGASACSAECGSSRLAQIYSVSQRVSRLTLPHPCRQARGHDPVRPRPARIADVRGQRNLGIDYFSASLRDCASIPSAWRTTSGRARSGAQPLRYSGSPSNLALSQFA